MPPYPLLASSSHRPVRGLSIRNLDERRLGDFVGGQYANYNLSSVLFEDRSDDSAVISLSRWSPPAGEKPPFKEAIKNKFEKTQKGTDFGPSWSNHWLKVDIDVPDKWHDKEWVELEFDPSCEALIFDVNGKALQGITGGGDDNRRVDFPLKGDRKTKAFTLYIEVSCNGMFGVPSDHTGDPDPNRTFRLNSADIVVKRPQAWRLLWDWEVLRGCVTEMPKDSVLQNKALWICNKIMNTFRRDDFKTIDACRKIAEEVLGTDWEKSDVYSVESKGDPRVWSLGHTHIDTAWLWPFSSTQQKIARSWSTQLDLMDRYPEYKFTASTAQQYLWLEELYPELFERVKKHVEDGRFIPIGATFVENDANMPSGEAFVRQFVYGQRFFKSRFGKNTDIFWLPDSFGYNAQIPQLARSAGCDFFFTQKLSWSETNRFPHSTFSWTGLDDTQIIVHMAPSDNYDSRCGVNDITKAVRNNRNLDVQPAGLLLYGFGDGGGGPSAPMLERLRRERSVHNNGYTEMPKVEVGKNARQFYDHILETTERGERLPTWQGETYLEFHRGVQTSHGSIKRWNRKLEILLHNVEWVATCASLHDKSYDYPKQELDTLWEQTLKCQFHDVLPGSSIRLVYDDAERIYADVDQRAKKLLKQATAHLSRDISSFVGINTLAVPRRELVQVPLAHKSDVEVRALQQSAVQLAQDGSSALVLLEDVNAQGHLTLSPSPAMVMRNLEAVSVHEDGNGSFTMRNANLSLKISHGRITSIYDIAVGRELIAPGRSAGLTIAEDYPNQYDAWNIDEYTLDTMEEIRFDRVKIAERGPWRCSVALEATFGKSKATITLSLDAVPAVPSSTGADPRSLLRFDAEVDWQEKHRFLRFEVPTSLQSDTASFETQFGLTKRPTARNTTWEVAKFEVCAHKWADLSEANYGLAILNDSKYGHSAEGGTLRLSLLKGATYPDAHQDEGHHSFSFAIYPHAGNLVDSDVVTAARVFNNPAELSDGSSNSLSLATASPVKEEKEAETAPFTLEQSSPNGTKGTVILDTMKRGEADFAYYKTPASGKTTVVLRLYESLGAHAEVTLKSSSKLDVEKLVVTNSLEEELEDRGEGVLEMWANEEGGNEVVLQFRPFEFKTVVAYVGK